MIKWCDVCGNEFERTSNSQKYCSSKCRGQQYRATHKEEIKARNKKRYPRAHIKEIKACKYCGTLFETETKIKIFCSDTCSTMQWEKDNPEKAKSNHQATKKKHGKAHKLKYRYGMTIEDKHKMYGAQGCKCGICHNEFVEDSLVIDHNHKTEEVRGLLCRSCNSGIGHFSDDVNTILNAINYLNNNRVDIIESVVLSCSSQNDRRIVKTCEQCGDDFVTLSNACFCSKDCRNKQRCQDKPKQYCFICDKEFCKKRGTRFCSCECANKQWDINNYSERARSIYLKEIERRIKRLHDNQMIERYGITTECKHKIWTYQEQKCGICLVHLKEESLYVDHDHESKKVRGLLCVTCNYGIGDFGDNIENLFSAIEYLKEKHESDIDNTILG